MIIKVLCLSSSFWISLYISVSFVFFHFLAWLTCWILTITYISWGTSLSYSYKRRTSHYNVSFLKMFRTWSLNLIYQNTSNQIWFIKTHLIYFVIWWLKLFNFHIKLVSPFVYINNESIRPIDRIFFK